MYDIGFIHLSLSGIWLKGVHVVSFQLNQSQYAFHYVIMRSLPKYLLAFS